MKWPVLRFVWEARGQKMEIVSSLLKERWPRGGFSESSLQRLTNETMDEVPAEVVAFVLGLAVEPGFEHSAAIVEAGLKALEGAPIDPADLMTQFVKKLPQVDPQVIAKAIEALASDVRELSRKVDAHAQRADRERKEGNGELRTELRRMVWTLGALTVAVGLLQVACQYAARSAKPGDAAQTRGGGAAGEIAQGGQWDPYGWLARVVAGETGERKEGRPMPHQPLPHQAVAPCQGRAEALYGGCWYEGKKSPPCGPGEYQEGNSCYIPIGADPNVPVGGPEKPQHGQEEPSGERSHGDMPGREEE